jgi:hypothetical protein
VKPSNAKSAGRLHYIALIRATTRGYARLCRDYCCASDAIESRKPGIATILLIVHALFARQSLHNRRSGDFRVLIWAHTSPECVIHCITGRKLRSRYGRMRTRYFVVGVTHSGCLHTGCGCGCGCGCGACTQCGR